MKTPLERFLKYVRIETTSSEETTGTPSTACQFDLARILVDELLEIGLSDAKVDERCYVTATLPANFEANDTPIVGLIAHLDTSCAASGVNVKPKVIEYSGGDIVLENGTRIVETEEMRALIGDRLVVTDGTTLLGADDKAGIAAIMAALERLVASPELHGDVRICFTPDEEIGNGTAFFDVEAFGADCAYTVDGGAGGEINCETFTADKALLTVQGVDVHPGEAKLKMVNASRALAHILSNLPMDRAPETTDNREPFIHVYKMEGGVSQAKAELLIRAFDEKERERNKQILIETAGRVSETLGYDCECDVVIKEQYLNMGYFLKNQPEVLSILEEATRSAGLEPCWVPIRGGTDGSRLTEMGLPTPNIFTGGRNFHSTMEFLDVEEHEKAMSTIIALVRLWAGQKRKAPPQWRKK